MTYPSSLRDPRADGAEPTGALFPASGAAVRRCAVIATDAAKRYRLDGYL
jgi:hypothetical protein